MSGWDNAKQVADSHKGGGKFIRLQNDKDKVIVAFVGDVATRELIWDGKGYVAFTAEHKAAGKTSSPRFVMQCYVPGEKRIKYFEANIVTFKDILKVRDKYGFDKFFFEIERAGAKGDTKTTYSVLPDKLITELDNGDHVKLIAEQKLLTEAELLKLVDDEGDDDGKADMNSHGKTNGAAAAPAATIDGETATKLAAELKPPCPKEILDGFLSRFGIQKIKELKAADATAAFAFIAEKKKPAAAPAADDPFI